MDELLGFVFIDAEGGETGLEYPELSIRVTTKDLAVNSDGCMLKDAFYIDNMFIVNNASALVEIINTTGDVIYSWVLEKEDVYTEKLLKCKDSRDIVCVARRYSNTQGKELKKVCNFLFSKVNNLTIPEKLQALFKIHRSHSRQCKKYAKYRRFYIKRHKK